MAARERRGSGTLPSGAGSRASAQSSQAWTGALSGSMPTLTRGRGHFLWQTTQASPSRCVVVKSSGVERQHEPLGAVRVPAHQSPPRSPIGTVITRLPFVIGASRAKRWLNRGITQAV